MLKSSKQMENKVIDYLKLFASLEHLNSKYEKVEEIAWMFDIELPEDD